jgi:hypothetical protein
MTDQAIKPLRKYALDVSVGFASLGAVRLTSAELHSGKPMADEPEELVRRCHVYAICRQPFLSIDPNTFAIVAGQASGDTIRRVKGVAERHYFCFPVDPELADKIKVAPYPHRSLMANGDEDRHWPAMLFGALMGRTDPSFLLFEVLYIGQAFGKAGERDALARLRSHPTLQKILAVGANDFPDDEISIVALAFDDPMLFTITDGRSPLDGGGAWDHVRQVLENPLSEGEQIDLIEAGLIRYFQPRYNVMFRENFPSASQKILQGLYETDIAGLVVEIDTEVIHARLWSPTRGDGTHHMAKFDLHDGSVRQSFFTLTGPDGEVVPSLESGPSF